MKDNLHPSDGNGAAPFGAPQEVLRPITTELRILATTDVHMQLLGFDYVRDQPVGHHGLAGLATLIKTARTEAAAQEVPCLLVDNGDMLQGSALGDALARLPVTPKHPVVASLNVMGYDAIGVGNHDLDHGLTYLQRIAGLSKAPFISSNMRLDKDSAILASSLIACPLSDQPGTLTLGLLSVLPGQTGVWNKPMLDGQAHVTSAQEALREAVPQLRARGAEVVVLLAHMGVEDTMTQDDVRALATLPGIDAMIAGHTHRRLPGQDHAGFHNVDINKGALGPCPAAMPGFNASDLAVLDLRLTRSQSGAWHVADHAVQLRANTVDVPPDPEVLAICKPTHARTRTALAEPVGQSINALHNFFSLAVPTTTCALTALTKRRVVEEGLRGTPEAALPLIATASAHTAGGRSGPDHFLNIAPGTIFRRALAGLSPYENAICALRVTGADLRGWLEHTIGIYTELIPQNADQPLLRADRPTFHFDTIYGLRYGVDPTQPAGQRITRICFEGRPVEAHQQFILATHQFRAAGGGGGAQFGPAQTVFETETTVADALFTTFKGNDLTYPAPENPWYFDCSAPVRAVLQTSPQAIEHLDDIAHLSPEPLPVDLQGFMPVRLSL